uniref:Uncharacterized protein n=1 Tax=Pseudomonas fluorescens (strain SBW25) TaxID=216595 RepID=A0A0G4E6C7_PSEFS|nr:hypothetical protein [Pseudomonas fluorescens]CEK42502.1 hypothetical protein PQBR55_0123 [Pseudomonas fluorescens SBW25]
MCLEVISIEINRIGLTVYGCRDALKFEPTVTEAGDPPLLIEATNGGPYKYSWNEK